jgi:hypothetical protein
MINNIYIYRCWYNFDNESGINKCFNLYNETYTITNMWTVMYLWYDLPPAYFIKICTQYNIRHVIERNKNINWKRHDSRPIFVNLISAFYEFDVFSRFTFIT